MAGGPQASRAAGRPAEPPPHRAAPTPWPPPWPRDGDAAGFADAARRAWSRARGDLSPRLPPGGPPRRLEKEVARSARASTGDRQAIRRQLGRHVDVLRTVQTRLNLVMVMMISVGLFALAGPGGLYDMAPRSRAAAPASTRPGSPPSPGSSSPSSPARAEDLSFSPPGSAATEGAYQWTVRFCALRRGRSLGRSRRRAVGGCRHRARLA